MNTNTASGPVHYFDPVLHSVPCGAPGFEERSTKHERNVTCQACVAFLRARTARAQGPMPTGLGDAHV